MAEQPVVYILHGDDEVAISDFVKGLFDSLIPSTKDQTEEQKKEAQSMAELNTVRLDGHTNTLDDLVRAANTISFFAERRLVIFERPLERIRPPKKNPGSGKTYERVFIENNNEDKGQSQDIEESIQAIKTESPQESFSQLQEKFLKILNNVPPTTILSLVFDQPLTSDRDLKDKKLHWLEKWVKGAGERVSLHRFMLPSGPELSKWIQARVKKLGGQFTLQAVAELAAQIGPEPRILESEIEKLLAYVNNARAVEIDDVQHVSSTIRHQEDFGLVNALRTKNFNQVMKMLKIDLDHEDPKEIFPGIVYQFRLLLLTRETLDIGGTEADVIELGKIVSRDRPRPLHPYVARLAVEQARRFTHAELDDIYHRLLEADVALKTSGMVSNELVLEVLVTQLTQN